MAKTRRQNVEVLELGALSSATCKHSHHRIHCSWHIN